MGKRVLVIGAGLIGMSIAAHVAAAGASVTVLCAERPGTGTALATFAWYNALIKFPVDYLAMNVNGMRAHERYAARHVSAPWLHPGGSLEISVGDEGLERQVRIYNEMIEHGYNGRWISIDELLTLEPALDRDALRGGKATYYPDEGYIDVASLIFQLMLDARAAGATIRSGAEVVGFDMANGKISAARLADGTRHEADLFINAAGPAAERLAAAAGCVLPMANTSGVLIYTPPVAATVHRVIHAPLISIRPDGGGRLCLHDHAIDAHITKRSDADASLASSPKGYAFDKRDAEPIMERLRRFIPSVGDSGIEVTRIGVRPIPVDKMPVVGMMPGCENLYSAAMHSGVTQCIWVGELVAKEVVRETPQDALKSFRPQRFVNSTAATAKQRQPQPVAGLMRQ